MSNKEIIEHIISGFWSFYISKSQQYNTTERKTKIHVPPPSGVNKAKLDIMESMMRHKQD